MDLWQIDMAKRVPYAYNPSGFYYWTSVYYADRDYWDSNVQMFLDFLQLEKLLTTTDVEIVKLRAHNPPGRGNIVYEQGVSPGNHGVITSEGEYSMIEVARWHLLSDSGRRTYRLNRMPLRPSDVDGMELSASGLIRQQTSMNTLLAQEYCRNSYGELLTSGDVVRRLTQWQMRHGTKRRERNPLA